MYDFEDEFYEQVTGGYSLDISVEPVKVIAENIIVPLFDTNAATEELAVTEVSVKDASEFKRQFKFIYGKEPTSIQLKTYIDFMLGKETDIAKVERICMGEETTLEPANA